MEKLSHKRATVVTTRRCFRLLLFVFLLKSFPKVFFFSSPPSQKNQIRLWHLQCDLFVWKGIFVLCMFYMSATFFEPHISCQKSKSRNTTNGGVILMPVFPGSRAVMGKILFTALPHSAVMGYALDVSRFGFSHVLCLLASCHVFPFLNAQSQQNSCTACCRIVLICAKRSLLAAFSVLPYGESFHIRYRITYTPSRCLPIPASSPTLSFYCGKFKMKSDGNLPWNWVLQPV